jgi:hypothetical protein
MATVLIPWRAGCPHRLAALAWVIDRYHALGWGVLTGTPPDGPWCKGLAVASALSCTNDERLVVADADVWTDGIVEAVEQLDNQRWAIPHRTVYRLNEYATADVLDGSQPDLDRLDGRPYYGTKGGGVVAIRRSTLLDIPIDPRFQGWGGEDRSWGIALHRLAGNPWVGLADLIHLWHPPQDDAAPVRGPKAKVLIPDDANRKLEERYRAAKQYPPRMRALVDEAREVLWPSVSSSTVPT